MKKFFVSTVAAVAVALSLSVAHAACTNKYSPLAYYSVQPQPNGSKLVYVEAVDGDLPSHRYMKVFVNGRYWKTVTSQYFYEFLPKGIGLVTFERPNVDSCGNGYAWNRVYAVSN